MPRHTSAAAHRRPPQKHTAPKPGPLYQPVNDAQVANMRQGFVLAYTCLNGTRVWRYVADTAADTAAAPTVTPTDEEPTK